MPIYYLWGISKYRAPHLFYILFFLVLLKLLVWLAYYLLSRGLLGGSGTPLLIGLDGGGVGYEWE